MLIKSGKESVTWIEIAQHDWQIDEKPDETMSEIGQFCRAQAMTS